MDMFSIQMFALVAVSFVLIYCFNKFVKDKVKKITLTNTVLLIASYLFVLYADFRFAIVLFLLTLCTWFFAKKESRIKYGIIISLMCLGYFKYTNFFISSISKMLNIKNEVVLNIILPLGISFYSFSAISYLVDVYRKKTKPHSLFDVALYLAFFPKFSSGPIQKSKDFFSQLCKERKIGVESFSEGIQIFCIGLFKKSVIADHLSVFVNQVYETPKAFSSLTVLFAVITYSLEIYFDFAGYSDMAIGVAKILGFDLPDNFNLPYLAQNVTEFWKRWHITLSSWLQEYLYIPLGGNRKGKVRTYVNLILTMVIGGIWHGANFTFIIWGLLHGIALALHKVWMNVTGSKAKESSVFARIISTVLTFVFTTFCWIFFRSDSLAQAFEIIKRIFAADVGVRQPYFWTFFAIVILVLSHIVCIVKSRNNPRRALNVSNANGYYVIFDLNKFWSLVAFFVFCGIIIGMMYVGFNPFIYGKF